MQPQKLEQTLSYTFTNKQLLHDALTHRSVGSCNNERLEYLGDAILSFVIADELYRRFPKADEGQLSRLRARLVKGETLASLARDLELGTYLKLGPGEMKSGGHRRSSILADTFEAMLGAIYLDADIQAVTRVIHELFGKVLDSTSLSVATKDAKTRLQEYLQARHMDLPQYTVKDVMGKSHAQTFEVECNIHSLQILTSGQGASRRKAEQMAAASALEMLGQ